MAVALLQWTDAAQEQPPEAHKVNCMIHKQLRPGWARLLSRRVGSPQRELSCRRWLGFARQSRRTHPPASAISHAGGIRSLMLGNWVVDDPGDHAKRVKETLTAVLRKAEFEYEAADLCELTAR